MNNEQKTVVYNHNTATYDTPDDTKVAFELVDNVQCMLDLLYISLIRDKQCKVIEKLNSIRKI